MAQPTSVKTEQEGTPEAELKTTPATPIKKEDVSASPSRASGGDE